MSRPFWPTTTPSSTALGEYRTFKVRHDPLGDLDRIARANVARRRLQEEEGLGGHGIVELLGMVSKVTADST